MMFRRTAKGICLVFSLLAFAGQTQAQRYEEMSPEIQGQMDLNKINGEPQWSGIQFVFEVGTQGLEPDEYPVLKARAGEVKAVLSMVILEGGKVMLVCEGGTPFDDVKHLFSNLVTGLSGIETKVTLKTSGKK